MELGKFLIKAKIATYPSVGEVYEMALEDGAKELTFEDGKFKYRDRYYIMVLILLLARSCFSKWKNYLVSRRVLI